MKHYIYKSLLAVAFVVLPSLLWADDSIAVSATALDTAQTVSHGTTTKGQGKMQIIKIDRINNQVQVIYDMPLTRPKYDYKVTMLPALVGEQDTLALEPIVLNGKNNIRELHRDHVLNHKGEPEQEYNHPKYKNSVLRDTLLLPLSEYRWVLTDSVTFCRMEQIKEGCCKVVEEDDECSEPYSYIDDKMEKLPTEVKQLTPVMPATIQPLTQEVINQNKVLVPSANYMPYLNTDVLSRRNDVLRVYYELDSIILKPWFRDNQSRLDTIIMAVNTLLADTMADVKVIQIVGLASVEGPYKHNVWLGDKRGQALKDYIVRETGIDESVFEVNNGAEAWAEFEWQLEHYDFEGKKQLMKVVHDNSLGLDQKERIIKQLNFGWTYKYLLENLLPDQRNAGYIRVFYELKTDYAAVAINEAIDLLKEHRYDEALEHLLPYKDDRRAYEALAFAYYMTGNTDKAEELWEIIGERKLR